MEQSAEHILACLSPAPSNARIIRTAATMAQAFGCRFTALFVRTPGYVNLAQEDKTRLRQHTLLGEDNTLMVMGKYKDLQKCFKI